MNVIVSARYNPFDRGKHVYMLEYHVLILYTATRLFHSWSVVVNASGEGVTGYEDKK